MWARSLQGISRESYYQPLNIFYTLHAFILIYLRFCKQHTYVEICLVVDHAYIINILQCLDMLQMYIPSISLCCFFFSANSEVVARLPKKRWTVRWSTNHRAARLCPSFHSVMPSMAGPQVGLNHKYNGRGRISF